MDITSVSICAHVSLQLLIGRVNYTRTFMHQDMRRNRALKHPGVHACKGIHDGKLVRDHACVLLFRLTAVCLQPPLDQVPWIKLDWSLTHLAGQEVPHGPFYIHALQSILTHHLYVPLSMSMQPFQAQCIHQKGMQKGLPSDS